MEAMEISVRSMPAPGHIYRRRAGRAWGKEAVTVIVTETPNPKHIDAMGRPLEITPAQFAELKSDPHIMAAPAGGGDPEIPGLVAQLAAKDEEIARLRKDHADAVESAERQLLAVGKHAEAQGARIAELEGEVERMRAQLAKKRG
jgi:uncharacterized small protein (DUF1192 family)